MNVPVPSKAGQLVTLAYFPVCIACYFCVCMCGGQRTTHRNWLSFHHMAPRD